MTKITAVIALISFLEITPVYADPSFTLVQSAEGSGTTIDLSAVTAGDGMTAEIEGLTGSFAISSSGDSWTKQEDIVSAGSDVELTMFSLPAATGGETSVTITTDSGYFQASIEEWNNPVAFVAGSTNTATDGDESTGDFAAGDLALSVGYGDSEWEPVGWIDEPSEVGTVSYLTPTTGTLDPGVTGDTNEWAAAGASYDATAPTDTVDQADEELIGFGFMVLLFLGFQAGLMLGKR